MTAAFITLVVATLAGCAPPGPSEEDPEDAEAESDAIGADSIATIAMDNVGNKACGQNSLGGTGFESSCTGNGGQPEYWCSDFARWVWKKGCSSKDGEA
jgi:hypothetical protein